MPETTTEILLAYLRQHGERHSEAVLRDHLVAQGYDPDKVDRALAAYRLERQRRGLRGPGFGSFLLAIVLGLLQFGLFLYAGHDTLQHPHRTFVQMGVGLVAGLAVLAGEGVVGIILIYKANASPPDWGALLRSVGWGLTLAVVVTFVLPFLAVGVCFVKYG
ncbi:MAG TPA: hypothetical protein VFE33_11115 [Thermoanaerobaculia bacterium]|nr:hypothetical protein [Thermoanaerobaculia bacterium]